MAMPRIRLAPSRRTAAWLLVWLATGVGCTAVLPRPTGPPGHFTVVRQQLVFHSDFALAAHHRLLDDLTVLRAELSRQIELPSRDEPIDVYLFESPDRFERFVRARLGVAPSRRAYFVQSDTRLEVYAQWGDKLAEDLRHEVTHGYVHAAIAEVPLWLDEGLAEYFEVGCARRGLNETHRERLAVALAAGGWRPDLRRLERMDPGGEMSQDDYAESWAWIHYLLNGRPELRDVLRAYLTELRSNPAAAPMSARLAQVEPRVEDALIEHVRRLGAAGGPPVPLRAAAAGK